jgi:hypothetical protein
LSLEPLNFLGLPLVLGLELVVVIFTLGQHAMAGLFLRLGIPQVLSGLLQILLQLTNDFYCYEHKAPLRKAPSFRK